MQMGSPLRNQTSAEMEDVPVKFGLPVERVSMSVIFVSDKH